MTVEKIYLQIADMSIKTSLHFPMSQLQIADI